MIIAVTCLIAIVIIAYVLGVRAKDLPQPEPVSPFKHLDDRKAAIYENLRDLTFEYRVGKLSDADYQSTKLDLQKELAAVLAEVERVGQAAGLSTAPQAKPVVPKGKHSCSFCGATFAQDLKFCGECGKPMKVAQ